MANKEHDHTYIVQEPKLIRPDNIHFTGSPKGIVLKRCECGDEKFIDYGEFNQIKDKWKSRKEKA